MTVAVNKLKNEPHWRLGLQTMENEITLEMLGVLFSSDGHSNPHVNNRIMKCRRSFYSLSGCGMSFPGPNVDIKTKLESLQDTLMKSALGLSVHSHHAKLMRALNLAPVGEIYLKKQYVVCGINFLWSTLRWEIYVSGNICPWTFFPEWILKVGVSPLLCSLNANAYKSPKIFLACGIKESLANRLTDPTIQFRESVSHKLLCLLTRY